MKIKAILAIYRSRRDLSGNTYWAFRVTDPVTGKTVHAQTGHRSNVLAACCEIWGDAFYWHEVELAKGEFKNAHAHAACPTYNTEALAAWIRNQLTGGNTL